MSMNLTDLTTSIRNFVYFDDEELDHINEKFNPKHYKKGILLHSGEQVASEVYFISKGCLRLYYIHNGNDISAFFFTEGMFGGAYDSFITRQPCRHLIETIEDTDVYVLSYTDMQALFLSLPKMNELVRKIIENRFVLLHQLFTSHILDSPEERYIHLVQSRPDLVKRVPQHQLATFLGVTPVSLSRIRNRLARK